MGKWSPNYTEDLLQTKISTLVTGALRRAAVDNDATIGNMTYENFVHDLDTGDSFAATMIDILVKELAERRARHQADGRFLSTRTVKSLRQLATPLNQYPSRVRGAHLHRRPIIPDATFEEMDDENFSLMLDDSTEGVHMSSADLYDAMSVPWTRRASEEPSSSSVRTAVPPLSVRSPPINPPPVPWSVLPPPSPVPVTLTRQASVRRPFTNSRNIEFSNFTRRHRLNHRDTYDGDGVESVTEPRDEPLRLRSTGSSAARRFFPAVAAHRLRRTEGQRGIQRPAIDVSDGTSSGDEDPLSLTTGAEQFVSYIGHPVRARASSVARAGGPTDATDEPVMTAPRLRRGGVRAPESFVSRNASPPLLSSRTEASTSQNVAPEEALGELTAYPTPGSSEGELAT